MSGSLQTVPERGAVRKMREYRRFIRFEKGIRGSVGVVVTKELIY